MKNDNNNKTESGAHALAKKFKRQIKETVAEEFSASVDTLRILFGEKDGIYVSKEDPSTLCCLVVGEKDKFLYLVTANMQREKDELKNFNARVIS